MLIALGQRFHPGHFLCSGQCGREISSSTYFVLSDSDRQRLKWLAKERGDVLEEKKELQRKAALATGTTVIEVKAALSRESSTKTKINQAIMDQQGWEDDGKIKCFCDMCYGNLFRTICFACSQDVLGNALRVDKKSYHDTCYQCVTCFLEKDPGMSCS
jgi:hypothetical protein